MQKHVIHTYTDESLISRQPNNRYIVSVLWRVDFDQDATRMFDLKKQNYQHDYASMKHGVGKVDIIINRHTDNQEEMLAYAESLAMYYVVDIDSINCFSILPVNGIAKSVRRDLILLKVSQPLSRKLLNRETYTFDHSKPVSEQEIEHEILKNSTQTEAAYFYLSKCEEQIDGELKSTLGIEYKYDYNHVISDADIYQSTLINSPFGQIAVTWDSVDDYYNHPYNQYRIKEKNTPEVRPYDSVKRMVTKVDELITEGDSALKRLREKVGNNYYLLRNNNDHYTIQIKMINPPFSELFHVVGFRYALSRELNEKLALRK